MEKILNKFNTRIEGLSKEEVLERQNEYGFNRIEEKKPTPLVTPLGMSLMPV